MSNIKKAFDSKKAFIGFLTAGDPNLDKTSDFIIQMEKAGADLIEIGIPFSDPIAEGVVIQEADIRALKAGTTIDKIFDMVKKVREVVKIPMVFMTYLNPVFYYGYEKFCTKCEEIGIDGIIIPDMPYEEKSELDGICSAHNMDLISMIAPTSEKRIKQIASEAKGFLYVVSSMGVTGVRSEITTDIGAMIKAVKEVSDIPAAVGFGISTPKQASDMAQCADGVIVGSAIVRIIAEKGEDAGQFVYDYVHSMKQAII